MSRHKCKETLAGHHSKFKRTVMAAQHVGISVGQLYRKDLQRLVAITGKFMSKMRLANVIYDNKASPERYII